jgi:chromosome segregation ATPase
MRKNTMAGSTLTKRSTLASMMLHGRVDVNRDDDDNDGMGTELESGRGEEEEEEEGLEGGTNTAERLEAEQIFMPNMRREAFIPVRIARDKLKQVLKEMAQMKHMHYAALETMERQQEFLKAQLEATVATYARKLTNDYNTRVKALEGEYQRRLDGLNKTAMGDLQATLDAARRDAKLVEQRMQAQLMEKDREIEQERKMFQTKIQMTRQAQEDMDKQVEAARTVAKEKDREIERLTVELRVAKAAGGAGGGDSSITTSGAGDSAQVEALKAQVTRLERDLAEKTQDHDQLREERASFEQALDERDQEIAQLHEQLAQFAEGGGELVVAGGDESGGAVEEEGEEEGAVIVGGEDEEGEEGEEDGIQVVESM